MGNAQRHRARVVLHGDRSLYFSGIVQHGEIDLDVTEHGSIEIIDLFEPNRFLRAILMREGSADVHMRVRGIPAGDRLRCHLMRPGQYFTPRRIRLVLKSPANRLSTSFHLAEGLLNAC